MDSLLPYYDRELAAIRKLAGEFAADNPKVASRLRMTAEAADDPHVERLLEGAAFLAARVQQRLDDELPEISDALLEILCPHMLAPVPSMTTVRLAPKPEAAGRTVVSRGAPFQTDPVRGYNLQYRTCQDVELWPVRIEDARLVGLPLTAPANPMARGAAAALRLVLSTTAPELTFADLGLDRLRLHLRGAGPLAAQILELLCTSTMSIALADGPKDERPTILGPENLAQAGFEPEEAALPWPQRAFNGQRLLTEYFAFPEKFFYIDLAGLDARTHVHQRERLEIFVYLSRAAPALERTLGPENFLLGCTPAINLFPQIAEPIALDGVDSEWLVVPDARQPGALEVYSIEQVRLSRPDEPRPATIPHFHRLRLDFETSGETDLNWFASRRPAPSSLGGGEVRLSMRDVNFDPTRPADGVLTVDTMCCNRDLPSFAPFGGGQPVLRLLDPTTPAGNVECISPLTPTQRPQLRERSAWRLISHLSLNHLGVTGGAQGALALREMLRMHDLRHTPEAAMAINGLVSVDARPGAARIPGARPGSFAKGVEIAITFEPQAWTAGGLFVLCGVIERFFALQVSINAFVRTSAYLRGRERPVATWPARSGSRVLV